MAQYYRYNVKFKAYEVTSGARPKVNMCLVEVAWLKLIRGCNTTCLNSLTTPMAYKENVVPSHSKNECVSSLPMVNERHVVV